jgi:hypothetical protein
VFSTASSFVMVVASPSSMCGHTQGMACCPVLCGTWVVTVETRMLRSPSILYTWPRHGLVMSRLVHPTWLNSIGSTLSSCRFGRQGAGHSPRLIVLLSGDLVVRPASLGCSVGTRSSVSPRWIARPGLGCPSRLTRGVFGCGTTRTGSSPDVLSRPSNFEGQQGTTLDSTIPTLDSEPNNLI